MTETAWQIGIDEVGRGPLAGPVAVGVVAVPPGFAWAALPEVNDSKQVREDGRRAVQQAAATLRRQKQLRYTVAMTSANVIDAIGIVPAIDRALKRGLRQVTQGNDGAAPLTKTDCVVKLDGGLRAPRTYTRQETIIRGDGIVPVISLASIVAKVARDTYMQRLAAKSHYAGYGFATHKGYGTVAHRAAIARQGVSDQHRRSFCRQFV